jgi:hypothetical protein
MTGRRAHKALTVKYSRELIEEFLGRREVESTIPFLAIAMRCASTRSEFSYLKELLSQGITICTEHVSYDQSCHRDALSAYTLSRLIEMHGLAAEQITIRYFFQKNYRWLRSFLSSFFKRNSVVVPLLFHGQDSFDNVNTSSHGAAAVAPVTTGGSGAATPSYDHRRTPSLSSYPFQTIPSSVSLI